MTAVTLLPVCGVVAFLYIICHSGWVNQQRTNLNQPSHPFIFFLEVSPWNYVASRNLHTSYLYGSNMWITSSFLLNYRTRVTNCQINLFFRCCYTPILAFWWVIDVLCFNPGWITHHYWERVRVIVTYLPLFQVAGIPFCHSIRVWTNRSTHFSFTLSHSYHDRFVFLVTYPSCDTSSILRYNLVNPEPIQYQIQSVRPSMFSFLFVA